MILKKKKKFTTSNKAMKHHYLNMGKIFGYSPCCINFFSYHFDYSYSDFVKQIGGYNPFAHSGYVPCKQCASKDPLEVIEKINQRRSFPYPFPIQGDHKDTSSALKELILILSIVNPEVYPSYHSYLNSLKEHLKKVISDGADKDVDHPQERNLNNIIDIKFDKNSNSVIVKETITKRKKA